MLREHRRRSLHRRCRLLLRLGTSGQRPRIAAAIVAATVAAAAARAAVFAEPASPGGELGGGRVLASAQRRGPVCCGRAPPLRPLLHERVQCRAQVRHAAALGRRDGGVAQAAVHLVRGRGDGAALLVGHARAAGGRGGGGQGGWVRHVPSSARRAQRRVWRRRGAGDGAAAGRRARPRASPAQPPSPLRDRVRPRARAGRVLWLGVVPAAGGARRGRAAHGAHLDSGRLARRLPYRRRRRREPRRLSRQRRAAPRAGATPLRGARPVRERHDLTAVRHRSLN
mmetsp:Transcript_31212/g.104274  ORF Transcript_31212/g.104274 Transcript_31212/m.104274 type:complete len:283 (+) Transcript_31212:289-1137(+)